MAIPFKNPRPNYKYVVDEEKLAIMNLFTERHVPTTTPGKLLLASWNIANLGVQKRWPEALELIAHILSRFDLIAVQEINDRYKAFTEVVEKMGADFDYIMSDPAGNNERLGYIYRKKKVTPANLFAELALRPREYPKRTVYVKWVDKKKQNCVEVYRDLKFEPFDRNPYIGSFKVSSLSFTLVNVHLYFGEYQNSRKVEERAKYARRVLEIYALSKWADRRFDKDTVYDKDIILLGDMNVPAMSETESTYKALIKFGWKTLDYVTRTAGSNLGNDKTYDQMVFAPGDIAQRITNFGVFDYDNAVFRDEWNTLESNYRRSAAISKFNALVKHHISDHRPIWIELNVNQS